MRLTVCEIFFLLGFFVCYLIFCDHVCGKKGRQRENVTLIAGKAQEGQVERVSDTDKSQSKKGHRTHDCRGV